MAACHSSSTGSASIMMSHPDDGNSLLRPDHYLDAAIELLFFD